MLLGTSPRPISVTTHEQNIAWSFSELLKELESPTLSDTVFPIQITESMGYYPSDVISVQPVRTVDGGYRHIYRLLMPVAAASYSGSKPIWEFIKSLAPGVSSIGLMGAIIPGTADRVRYNPAVYSGTVELLTGSEWINPSNGRNIAHAWIGSDLKVYTRTTQGEFYSLSSSSWNAGYVAITEIVYRTEIKNLASIRL